MQSIKYLLAFAPLAFAYTQPTEATWGPLLSPDLQTPVTAGETFEVKWDPESHPTDGVTVSLVLCHGDSSNCVPSDSAIVEGVPAAQKSYSWSVPSDLEPGTQSTSTGYGMLVIVDGTGEFQYSTQFSVLAGKGGKGSSSSSDKPTGSGKGDDDEASKTSGISLTSPTWIDGEDEDDLSYGGKNSTGYSHGGKNSTEVASTTVVDETTTTQATKPTKSAASTFEVQTSTEAVTADNSQPTASPQATPEVSTELSGAARNAAGALFLGAIAAAFML